jgi:chromate transporter
MAKDWEYRLQMSGKESAFTAFKLISLFCRVGGLTFGGGNASTAELHRQLVRRRGWLDESQFKLCYVVARITPGTNFLAFCVAVGWEMASWRGALIAILSISIPSSLIVLLLTHLYDLWSNQPIAAVIIRGILAAAIGIIVSSAFVLVRQARGSWPWPRIVLLVSGAIVLNVGLSLTPLRVLCLAAIVGTVMPVRNHQ